MRSRDVKPVEKVRVLVDEDRVEIKDESYEIEDMTVTDAARMMINPISTKIADGESRVRETLRSWLRE